MTYQSQEFETNSAYFYVLKPEFATEKYVAWYTKYVRFFSEFLIFIKWEKWFKKWFFDFRKFFGRLSAGSKSLKSRSGANFIPKPGYSLSTKSIKVVKSHTFINIATIVRKRDFCMKFFTFFNAYGFLCVCRFLLAFWHIEMNYVI